MTLLTVCETVAWNVGDEALTSVAANTSDTAQKALYLANEAGRELARRIDWSALHETTTLAGDGTDLAHSLPENFGRLQQGVTMRAGTSIVRPLTRQEWNTLTAVEGAPRYFLLENKTVRLWPFLADGETVTVQYQNKNWVANGEAYTADDQTADLDEDLLAMCMIVHHRRQEGMPLAEFEDEYEKALAHYVAFDRRARF